MDTPASISAPVIATDEPVRPPIAWLPIGGAAAAAAAVLVATNNRYDYHRDELYFRMLRPAWGYVDQPPLTPLLARASAAVFGDTVWAMRLPATVCVVAAIVLTALITRELGGGRRAQTLCAWGYAFAAVPLLFGHVMLTATVDLPVWAAVILFALRALLRGEPRWWSAAGAVTGIALYNKHLIVLLLVSLAFGLLWSGPRSALRSRWLWTGVGLAVLIGSPNLIYQATHGFPQLDMAAALSENKGGATRVQLLPFQLFLLGPPVTAIWVAGLVALFRRPAWRPARALAGAYPVLLVIVLISGGQIYYPVGLVGFLFAAGCVPTVDWAARRPGPRRALVVAGLALNTAVTLMLALPLLPVDVLGDTPIPAINQATRDQIGWPAYTREVAAVYAALPEADRAKAVIVTGNYGEAGALDRYGPDHRLPLPIYSGQNELYRYGPPPEAATVAVVVGLPLPYLQARFGSCTVAGVLDNGVGVDNEEQGRIIAVCRDPAGGWAAAWPRFQHFD
ncbi:glycosyltransferase family 39 protein [Actinoallomurus sp. NPDC052274]|uniref:glycosyltransferase family 39 protein n=1 Tax=Actinoallomurus sp. NPDC052274 TaxID=3155420 RepID=UPI00343C3B46